jgi:hypothetical protein
VGEIPGRSFFMETTKSIERRLSSPTLLRDNNTSGKADKSEQDTIVYQITDYTKSLSYASEMMERGYHVTTLIFKKGEPTPNNHDILLMEGC